MGNEYAGGDGTEGSVAEIGALGGARQQLTGGGGWFYGVEVGPALSGAIYVGWCRLFTAGITSGYRPMWVILAAYRAASPSRSRDTGMWRAKVVNWGRGQVERVVGGVESAQVSAI